MPSIEKRVRRGAKLLDRVRPGWADAIDTFGLNVRFANTCPLGQLYPSYEEARRELRIWLPARYGFHRSFFAMVRGLKAEAAEFVRLRHAWRAEIRTRRMARRPTNRVSFHAPNR